MEKLIKIRVTPEVTLPHTITKHGVTYSFTPDCDVPEPVGLALLKTYPTRYKKAEGKPSGPYKIRDEFQNKTLTAVVGQLSDEGKFKVFEFAKKLVLLERDGEEFPEPSDAVNLNELEVPQLKALSAKAGIGFTQNVKKADLVAALEARGYTTASKLQELQSGEPSGDGTT